MNVLVTGASTPLGERLVEELLADPEVGTVLALAIEPAEKLPATLRRDGVVVLNADLTKHRQVRELLFGPAFEHHIDAVVHLAMHRKASDVGRRVRRLNVDATKLLLRLAEEHPTIERFVFRSTSAVYRLRAGAPSILREDAELALNGGPQWLRDRVEADVMVGTRMGQSDLRVLVLRCAELLAPNVGSQLHDYLRSRVCLRPVGFDPMLNLLSVDDAVRALRLALVADAEGIFNVPGADSLPLSDTIRQAGRIEVPTPGPWLGPLYRWRRKARRTDFRYDLNASRLHHTGILDGGRASDLLGYSPKHPVNWDSLELGRGSGKG